MNRPCEPGLLRRLEAVDQISVVARGSSVAKLPANRGGQFQTGQARQHMCFKLLVDFEHRLCQYLAMPRHHEFEQRERKRSTSHEMNVAIELKWLTKPT